MATIKAVIVPAKALKDGKHKVRISVAHNGEVRYMLTSITVDSEKEFRAGQVVRRADSAMLNTKLRGELQRCQEAIDSMEYTAGLTCAELVAAIKEGSRTKNMTLADVFNEYVETARIKPGAKKQYTAAFSAVSKIIRPQMPIASVSRSTVLSLDRKMRDSGLAGATMRDRITLLRILVNYARRCGYAEWRTDPFIGFSMPKGEVRQSWLSVDEVRRVRDFVTTSRTMSRFRDFFMLSYYLGGINMADIVKINFSGDMSVLKYERTKTDGRSKANRYVEFCMPEEAREIIARLRRKDGMLDITDTQRNTACNSFISHMGKKFSAEIGIPNLIFYSARKSFAQHAFTLGVDTSVIDYILGHSLGSAKSCIYSYIKVTPEMATAAIRKVLDNLK